MTELADLRAGGNDAVDRSLHRHSRLRLWLLGIWICAVPVLYIIGMLRPPGWLMAGLLVSVFISWLALVLAHQLYRCPRCRRFFHVRGLYGNAFTSKCLNCGLPL
jgi:hypothetical protein